MDVVKFREDLIKRLRDLMGDKEMSLYTRIEWKCNVVVDEYLKRHFHKEIFRVRFAQDGRLFVLFSGYDGDYWADAECLSTKTIANIVKIVERW